MILLRPSSKCRCGCNLVWAPDGTDPRCWSCGKDVRKGTQLMVLREPDPRVDKFRAKEMKKLQSIVSRG